jgi:hypothetical protein
VKHHLGGLLGEILTNRIDEIEQAYEIGFTLDETTGSKNIGELINVILKHIGDK